jgi:8-oxo-dGTP diphosphatase
VTLARFETFHELPEAAHAARGPLRFAVVLARAPGGVVLVFNRYRKVWELPGGLLDPGETPRDSAARELLEEAGCVVHRLEWLGVVQVNDGHTHLGAVFTGCLEADPGRFVSEETGGLALWTPPLAPSPVGDSDTALLHRFWPRLAKSPA